MKALILSAAILGIMSCANAKECHSVYTNNIGATIEQTGSGFNIDGQFFNADVEAANPSLVVYKGEETADTTYYRVYFNKTGSVYSSEELAKLVGGSPIFMKRCK